MAASLGRPGPVSRARDRGSNMEFTKSQNYIIEHLSSLKLFSIILALSGLFGLLLGLHNAFFRAMSPDVRSLNFTLICDYIGIFISGCLLKHAYGIVEKLSKNK